MSQRWNVTGSKLTMMLANMWLTSDVAMLTILGSGLVVLAAVASVPKKQSEKHSSKRRSKPKVLNSQHENQRTHDGCQIKRNYRRTSADLARNGSNTVTLQHAENIASHN
jgi:hypothetical protein